MTNTRYRSIVRTIAYAGLGLALIAGSTVADAQSREDRWEFSLGTFYQFGADLGFEGGSTVETDGELGFMAGFGYNFSDKLAVNFGFNYESVGYDANLVGNEDGVGFATGSYDSWALSVNAVYYFSDGPITPYVGAGIGYTWIDTNIPTGPPITGCWWDPWWGYVCYTDYPTAGIDGFSYQAMLGLRYEFTDTTFMRFYYTSQWMDVGNITSTPRFDVLGLDIGWMF